VGKNIAYIEHAVNMLRSTALDASLLMAADGWH